MNMEAAWDNTLYIHADDHGSHGAVAGREGERQCVVCKTGRWFRQLMGKFNAKSASQERMRSAFTRNRVTLNPTPWDIERLQKLQKHCTGMVSHQVKTDISSIRKEINLRSSLVIDDITAPVLPLNSTSWVQKHCTSLVNHQVETDISGIREETDLQSSLVMADIPVTAEATPVLPFTDTLDIREETPSTDSCDDQEIIFDTMYVSNASKLLLLPHNLQSLEIEGCASLDVLPDDLLDGVPDLKELRLINCDSLTTLTLDLFPRLKILAIWKCPNLVSLNVTGEYIGGDLLLESLDIKDCPGLKSFPDERFHTPKLHTMRLSSCKSLYEFPKFMNSPTSLHTLVLHRCPNIQTFPSGGLPSGLIILSIADCDNLTSQKDWGLENIKSLDHFNINGCIGLESFPEEKLHVRNIIFLHMSNLKSLKKLDDKGFQHLNALQELAINDCGELWYLPEQGLPSSLIRLYVKDCPKLTPSLKPEAGMNWNKVAHIQFIEIDHQIIKDSSYRLW